MEQQLEYSICSLLWVLATTEDKEVMEGAYGASSQHATTGGTCQAGALAYSASNQLQNTFVRASRWSDDRRASGMSRVAP
jgi:hypothetical protein